MFELQVSRCELQTVEPETWRYVNFEKTDSGEVFGVGYIVWEIDTVYFVTKEGVLWCLFVDVELVDDLGDVICWLFLEANIILAECE